MKNLLISSSIVTVAFAFTVSNISLLAFSGGNGTVNNPYQIANKADLKLLADSTYRYDFLSGRNWSYGKYFILMNDIDTLNNDNTIIGFMSNTSANGMYNDTAASFQGHFNGNNKKITISFTSSNISRFDFIGIFGATNHSSVIENLNVDGIIDFYNKTRIGCIAAVNRGIVQNCNSYVSMKLNVINDVGGIVGISVNGSIINCNNYGTIDAGYSSGLGGIVGRNSAKISNCINIGDIKYNAADGTGGIVGRNTNYYNAVKEIESCLNIGTIISNGDFVGGISGDGTGANVKISNCINNGLIVGVNKVGGIAASLSSGSTISDCYNSGVVEGKSNVGCILGFPTTNVKIINCHYDTQTCGKEE